ncbi:MAG: hypothetical protein ACOYU0_05185 [Nitrospirota bacterium]
MKYYNRMFIWENIKRTNELLLFRNLVVQYFNSAPYDWMEGGRIENDEAVETRRQINLIIHKIKRYIREAGISTILYCSPPAIGGFSGSTDIFNEIFNDTLRIPENRILDIIERAIGVYQNDKVKSWIRTLNPFFWIYLILEKFVALPFKLLGLAGFNQEKIESSVVGKILKMIFGIIIVGAAFLTVLEKLGYLESFKILIARFIS